MNMLLFFYFLALVSLLVGDKNWTRLALMGFSAYLMLSCAGLVTTKEGFDDGFDDGIDCPNCMQQKNQCPACGGVYCGCVSCNCAVCPKCDEPSPCACDSVSNEWASIPDGFDGTNPYAPAEIIMTDPDILL